MQTALSSSIFRRGGEKKELFDGVQAPQQKPGGHTGQPAGFGGAEIEPELAQELEQLLNVLQAPKAG
jgi:hypothetical protein